MNPTRDIFDEALEWPLSKMNAWLDRLTIGGAVEGEPFNWDVFAFTIAMRAREERSPDWAHVALRIYDALVKRPPTGADAHTFWLSAMSLRAWMIAELGEREGDPVLDSAPIVEWVQRLTTMSLAEAAQWVALGDPRAIPIEKLRAMRRLKHALNTLAHALYKTQVEQKHPELVPWLQFRTRLF
ncbi:hypothetical protein ACLEPN_16055 [Myxococcus sp. 1LA]